MQRIARLIRFLKDNQFKAMKPIEDWHGKRSNYIKPGEYTDDKLSDSLTINVGDWLGNTGTTIFMEKQVEIPKDWRKSDVGIVLRLGANGKEPNCEALLSIDGFPLQGLDRNKDLIIVPEEYLNNHKITLKLEAFNHDGIPTDQLRGMNQVATSEVAPPPIFLDESAIVNRNVAVINLAYTLEHIFETTYLLDEKDMRRSTLIKKMHHVVDEIGAPSAKKLSDTEFLESLEQGLRKKAEACSGYKEGTIRAIGQSHIDVAWLWPIKETIRKISRTFSSACTLLDEYEHFNYAQSQPQLFAYLKKYHPKVFGRVKQKVKESRFEIIGGMWIEPDLNIPSGESLVRQLLYGKQFYKKEFDVESFVEWLPDTFGYCASLPQILKKADTDYFMTTKLNWNDTNRFPYDLFYWEGIDGTKILSYLHTVLGQEIHPKDIKGTWDDFKQKEEYPERMLVYGYGDGGGGVTRGMLERIERSKSLPGLPEVKYDTVHDFFERTKSANPNLPTWFGDLYLELHRGTYTTQAKTKRNNRYAESLYRELEIWSSFASKTLGMEYPMGEVKKGWELILLNQFHDIVPGTSISEVYDLSEEQYHQVFDIGYKLRNRAIDCISKAIDTNGQGDPIVLFNSLNWVRDEHITLTGGSELLKKQLVDEEGNIYKADYIKHQDNQVELRALIEDIPEMGYQTVWLQNATTSPSHDILDETFDGELETPFYVATFNQDGWLVRLYDKQADKEIIRDGEQANMFQLFDDRPTDWDAWDIDANFENQQINNVALMSKKIIHHGNLSRILKFEWKINESILTQEIIFYQNSRRIDFKTKVEWQEAHKLLKVAFPVNVHASRATYEIPFGSVERATHNNTSWEEAQYEVSGHRWVDLSEGIYGVSLLNDCKYGYDIKGNNIRLSLLRAPKWPDQQADIATHTFTYSLFPHMGDWREANTVKRAHELHSPVTVYTSEKHDGRLPNSMSFMHSKSSSAIVDTVKRSEKGDGIITRIYESEGSETSVQLKYGFEFASIEETNLLEKPVQSVAAQNEDIYKKVQPYEICTFHVE